MKAIDSLCSLQFGRSVEGSLYANRKTLESTLTAKTERGDLNEKVGVLLCYRIGDLSVGLGIC
jgi:hypothetical protein